MKDALISDLKGRQKNLFGKFMTVQGSSLSEDKIVKQCDWDGWSFWRRENGQELWICIFLNSDGSICWHLMSCPRKAESWNQQLQILFSGSGCQSASDLCTNDHRERWCWRGAVKVVFITWHHEGEDRCKALENVVRTDGAPAMQGTRSGFASSWEWRLSSTAYYIRLVGLFFISW